MDKILTVKQYYTQDVLKEIKLYTLDTKSEEGAIVIGSLSYRSGNASDCDLFETIIRDKKNDLIALFKSGIAKVVNNLMMTQNQYFLEVKLGLNPSFKNINYGICANDTYNVSDEFFEMMTEYYKRGLITSEDLNTIARVRATHSKGQIEYELIKGIIRKHTILRWTAREIFNGFKLLDSMQLPIKYTIERSVCEKSRINIEGIFINDDGLYEDCSNFFVLEYEDASENKHFLNLSDEALYDPYNYRYENLKESTYELAYSKLNTNLFKSLKRMLSIGRTFQNIPLIEKVYPLINSQLGQLYNVTSQMKTLMKIVSEHGIKPLLLPPLYHQLDKIRFRLQELIFLNADFSEIYDLVDKVLSRNQYVSTIYLYEDLSKITRGLLDYINNQTLLNMQKMGLYPLPQYLIPKNKPF